MIGNLWHLQVAASETTDDIDSTYENRKKKTTWIVVGVLAEFFTILSIAVVFVRRKQSIGALEMFEDSLVLFNYRDLRIATRNLSEKLGEKAFGSVFKGILPN